MNEKIVDGIYRIPVPLPGNPLKELNSYLIVGGKRPVLIDTGFRVTASRQALINGLAEVGFAMGEVDVLLTHFHSDHSGLAIEVAGQNPIYASEADTEFLSDPSYRRWHSRLLDSRATREGFPVEFLKSADTDDPARDMPPTSGNYQGLRDGQILEVGGRKLKCMQVPGHTPGHMCYCLEEEGILFTGDHVLFDISPNIIAWPCMDDALGGFLDNLRKVQDIKPELALPGHRKPGNLGERVRILIDHHEQRLEETLKVVREHPGLGGYGIASHMTWRIRSNSWEDFPLTQKWFAVGECNAHLDYLVNRGELERVQKGQFYHYYAV